MEWQPGDGWAPLCNALGEPVPDEPFPHTNTAEEFQAAMVDQASEAATEKRTRRRIRAVAGTTSRSSAGGVASSTAASSRPRSSLPALTPAFQIATASPDASTAGRTP